MPHPFYVHWTRHRTDETGELRGAFPDKDWDRLLRFEERADRLAETYMVKDGLQVGWSFRCDVKDGVRHEVRLPDPAICDQFVLRMRPFVLNNAPTFFNRVHTVLARNLDHPSFRHVLGAQHALFSGRSFRSLVRIDFNDTPLNTEAGLSRWLNADDYHQDPEKCDWLAPIEALMPVRPLFLSMMMDQAKAVLAAAGMVRAFRLRGGTTHTLSTSQPTAAVSGTMTLVEVPRLVVPVQYVGVPPLKVWRAHQAALRGRRLN